MRELIKGLMEGAAEPGQAQQPDKQGKKMKEIQVEVDLATDAMKDTVLKIQERGQVLDHLQERSGEYFYFDYVRSLETKGDTADESDNLSISSQSFRTTATKTRRRMFLQNAKVCGRLSSRPSLVTLHFSFFTSQFPLFTLHSSLFQLSLFLIFSILHSLLSPVLSAIGGGRDGYIRRKNGELKDEKANDMSRANNKVDNLPINLHHPNHSRGNSRSSKRFNGS
jgi:hypothetical protein